jgi:hypothetical protein
VAATDNPRAPNQAIPNGRDCCECSNGECTIMVNLSQIKR